MSRTLKPPKKNGYPHREHKSKKGRRYVPDVYFIKQFKQRKEKLKFEDDER